MEYQCSKCECVFEEPEDAEGCCSPTADGEEIAYCGSCNKEVNNNS
jgi:hypothetical protein